MAVSVMQLNGRYPDPQELITRLLRPITEVDSSYVPKVHLQSHLNGSLWRANLQMLWPVPFHTTGICMDPNRAQHYAYLQACNMYQVSITSITVLSENMNESMFKISQCVKKRLLNCRLL
jgi:hypothetical protein